MKIHLNWLATGIVLASSFVLSHQVAADVTITAFENFKSDALYPSWSPEAVTATATNYVVTATGYGANYKYIGFPKIDGTGCTNIELDVTLSGPAAADGQLGPIVTLIDGDGTAYTYCWYGQSLGHHVLTMPINSPTLKEKAGTVPGLDLTTLQHMHMKLDPAQFGKSGAYTIAWNNLRLTGVSSTQTKP